MKILLILSLALGLGASTPQPVHEMPGPVRSFPAPDGSGARIFYRPFMKDGGQASPVFYDNGRGAIRQVATIRRSMGLGWSEDGRRAFLQDNWGSNIADCYVLTRSGGDIAGVSLLKLIQRSRGKPRGAETPESAHYYVRCDAWSGVDRISGSVSGHTDTNPSHELEYPFTYDARTRQVIWQRTAS